MDLRSEILKEHTKAQSDRIAAWIGNDKKRVALLIDLFLHDEYRVVQRSAWILSIIADRDQQLILAYIPDMIAKMKIPGVHNAVKRNVVRILQGIAIPEKWQGDVMNICFDMLADVKEPIAVRCFSMTVLANLAKDYPDIKQELKSIIEDALQQGASAGFKARATKTLKALTKQ